MGIVVRARFEQINFVGALTRERKLMPLINKPKRTNAKTRTNHLMVSWQTCALSDT